MGFPYFSLILFVLIVFFYVVLIALAVFVPFYLFISFIVLSQRKLLPFLRFILVFLFYLYGIVEARLRLQADLQ